MAMHTRLWKANVLYSTKLHCRLCSSISDGALMHKPPTLPAVNAEPSLQEENRSEPAPRLNSFSGLLDSLVDTLCTNTSRDQLQLRQQVHNLQQQLLSLTDVPYLFKDKHDENKNSPSETSTDDLSQEDLLKIKPISQEELISMLLESKYIQRYTYNSDDILIDHPCRNIDSTKVPLDGTILDKHFGVNSCIDLLPEHFCVETSSTPVDNNAQSYTDTYDGIECDAYFSRYREHETNNEFPAFHIEISTPQFTGVMAFPEATEIPPSPVTSEAYEVQAQSSYVGEPSSNIVWMSGGTDSQVSRVPPEDQQKPNLDQLMRLQDHLADYLPGILKKTTDYRIYRADMVFENNYDKPYVSTGISAYAIEILKFRMWAHFKFANVKVQVLKITTHEDEGLVRAHVRVSGIPQTRAFMFWKFLPGFYRKSMKKEADWYEAIASYNLDGTGLVYKVTVDRTMSDKNPEVVENTGLQRKLSAILTPKPVMGGAACK